MEKIFPILGLASFVMSIKEIKVLNGTTGWHSTEVFNISYYIIFGHFAYFYANNKKLYVLSKAMIFNVVFFKIKILKRVTFFKNSFLISIFQSLKIYAIYVLYFVFPDDLFVTLKKGNDSSHCHI